MTPELRALLAADKGRVMTPLEVEQQVVSFAYGNAHYEDPRVTWEGVARHSPMFAELVALLSRP